MQFIEAFDTFRDAAVLARSYLHSETNIVIGDCLSAGNYVFHTNALTFQIWIYREKAVWNVIYCPPGSWYV